MPLRVLCSTSWPEPCGGMATPDPSPVDVRGIAAIDTAPVWVADRYWTVDLTVWEGDIPTATCPRCGIEEPDYDGFGLLAHVKPGYPNGCGYCAHPARDRVNGVWVCGICGQEEA